MLVLPEFSLLKRQPKVPHVSRVVMRRDVPNEYGTPITYTVHQSRNGKDWWIGASREGMRMSDTLHTSTRSKADAWIKAVQTGQIRIDENENLRVLRAARSDQHHSTKSIRSHSTKKPPAQLEREISEVLAPRSSVGGTRSLVDTISAGCRVTIVDRFGKQRTGRAVMRGPYGWVLNMGGRHGTPGIATDANTVSVRYGK